MPSSRGSSQPRNWTHVSYVSCIGRWVFFTTSTTWEAHALTTRSINSQKQQLKQKAAQTLRRSTGGTQVGISLGRIRRDFVIAVAIFQDWAYYMMLYGPWRELKSACSVTFQGGGRWEVVKPESPNSPSRLWDEWEVIQKQRQKKNCKYLHHSEDFLDSSAGKNPPAQRRPQLDSWVRKIPWRRDSSPLHYSWVSLVAQTVKNPPAKKEIWIRPQAWADTLEEGMATHSSILA